MWQVDSKKIQHAGYQTSRIQNKFATPTIYRNTKHSCKEAENTKTRSSSPVI